MATRARRRGDDVVDFKGVNAGGGGRSAHLPEDEGPYLFRIKKGERKEGEDSGKPYINWLCVVDKGPYKGKKVYNITSLNPKALWNLRGMMEASGINPGDRSMNVAAIIKRLTNKTFQAEVEDDEYNDKVKSKIAEYVVAVKDDDVDDEDDDDEEEDEEEEDEEEDEPAPRRGKAKVTPKPRSRKAAPVEDDEDEEEEDEEDDEEEEEPPAKKSRASARSTTKAASSPRSSKSSRSARRSKKVEDDDDEDLDDIDLDDL